MLHRFRYDAIGFRLGSLQFAVTVCLKSVSLVLTCY